MKTFRTKNYEIRSPKIRDTIGTRFAVMTDLHGLEFGEGNRELISAVYKHKPDAVLVLGDMIVREQHESLLRAGNMLSALASRYPVYYALGNHEYKNFTTEKHRSQYMEYEENLEKAGVRFLHNQQACLEIAGTKFTFHGLELPLIYYHKPNSPKLSLKVMEALIGTPSSEGVHVLLAHNPKYGNTYFSWGADLILSGHYHGGVVRLGEHRGLTSPQYILFPPYCCGEFRKGDRQMIVSAGLGEHTIPVRINNPRELLMVTMKPLENQE